LTGGVSTYPERVKNEQTLSLANRLYSAFRISICSPKGSTLKKIASIALAIAAVSLSAPASAQFAKAEDAIKYSKVHFS
jgi:hypothetical protein